MLIAVLAALGAAGSFAAGGVLQQRPASARPEGEALSFRLILDLAREPMWLLGIGFAFLSYALEGLALSFGPLVLVQPLIVTELLYALPISVRWRGMRMSSREWLGTLAVAGGLTLGLVFAAPGRAGPSPDRRLGPRALRHGGRDAARGLVRPGAGRPAAPVALRARDSARLRIPGRPLQGNRRARRAWDRAGAGELAGLRDVRGGDPRFPARAERLREWAARGEHAGGGRVDPSVAVVFGVALFHEHIRTGPWLVGIAAGIAVLLGGIVLLDTSPLVHCLQKVERRQRATSGSQDTRTVPNTARYRVLPFAGAGTEARVSTRRPRAALQQAAAAAPRAALSRTVDGPRALCA